MEDLLNLAGATLRTGIVVLAVAHGLRSTWADVMYLIQRPHLLMKSVLARNVFVPVVGVVIAGLIPLPPTVRAVILALSVTSVPPTLPNAEIRAGVRDSYGISLLATQSLLAIVFIPLTVVILSAALGMHAYFPPADVAADTGWMLALPFGLGMTVRMLWPSTATRLSPQLDRLSVLLLGLGAVVILALLWRGMWALVGHGTLIAMTLLVVAGLGIGHTLGGPLPDDRTALAVASASSHPGLALALVATNAPAQARAAATGVLIYLLVNAIVTRPYVKHRKRVSSPPNQMHQGPIASRRLHRHAARSPIQLGRHKET